MHLFILWWHTSAHYMQEILRQKKTQHNYVNVLNDYVNMRLTCMLQYVNTIMLHVDIIYLACRGRGMPPYETKRITL